MIFRSELFRKLLVRQDGELLANKANAVYNASGVSLEQDGREPMKIARVKIGGRVIYGSVQNDELAEIRGDIFGRFRVTNDIHKLSDLKLLPPTDPVQVWCPGPNFADHLKFAASLHPELEEADDGLPSHPQPWLKGCNSIIGPDEPIVVPKGSSGDIHPEGEAVAIIGKKCRSVTAEEAKKYILGYCCGNDVSERTWQKEDFSFWRAKGADSFCPVGPWIETQADPTKLEMMVRVNGVEVQRSDTSKMIHSFAEIISYISQYVTLYQGDLVFSGAAGVTQSMKAGDLVEVEVTGVGILRNTVKASD